MPLYEYECTKCGHRFEVIQKFSDPLAKKCPKCKGLVRKLLSAPAIQFKGSGWYVTDYPKGGGGGKKESEGANRDGEKKADATSKKDSKSDSKSDKKKGPS